MAIEYQGKVKGMFFDYQKAGQGPTIAFRHGAGDDSSIFLKLRERVHKEKGSTLLVDSRGHGYSDYGSVIRDDAENFAAVLRECGIQKTHLVGYSMGATQALNFAHQAPEKVEKMLLLAPVFFDIKYLKAQPIALLPFYHAAKCLYAAPEGEREFKDTDFTEGSTNVHRAFLERVRATGLKPMLAALEELEEVGFPDYLSALDHDTMIMAGKKDPLATHRSSEKLRESMAPNARLQWLDTGHVIINEDREGQGSIEAMLKSFLCAHPIR